MASLQRHEGGEFRVRFWFAGKQYFRSCQTAEQEQADIVLGRVKETLGLLKMGRLGVPPECDVGTFVVSGGKILQKPTTPDRHTLKDAVDAYFAAIPAGAKSPNSLMTERIHLGHFKKVLGDATPVETIGAVELQGYVAERSKHGGRNGRKIQAVTLKKELATFGQMWRFCSTMGWVAQDLGRRNVKLPKPAEKPPFQTWEQIEAIVGQGGLSDQEVNDLWGSLFLREEEIREFLRFVEEKSTLCWLYPMIATAAYTGARRSELRRAHLSDVDLQRRLLTVREKKRQHSTSLSYRRVDLHHQLAPILSKWIEQHPGGKYAFCAKANVAISPKEASAAFRAVVAGSKWKVLKGYHVLRHSFASICAMHGLRDATVSAWMGHETEEMKARYRHLFPETTKREMDRLFG